MPAESVNNTPSTAARSARLGNCVQLRAGYAFRTAIQECEDGPLLAVQLRDFRGSNKLHWEDAARTIVQRAPAKDELLRPEDILFAFRGTRYFAALLDEVPDNAVASNQFMLMRVPEGGDLLPAFLAWQLNQFPAQKYFERSAVGTAQQSLRRGAIEALKIAIPPLATQQKIAALARLERRERETLEAIIQIREEQMKIVAQAVLASAGER